MQSAQALGVVGGVGDGEQRRVAQLGTAAHRGGNVDTRGLRRLVEHDDLDAAALAASQRGHVGQHFDVEVGGKRLLKRAAKRRGGTDHERDGPMCRPGTPRPTWMARARPPTILRNADSQPVLVLVSVRGGAAEVRGRRRDASRPTTSPYPTRFSSARRSQWPRTRVSQRTLRARDGPRVTSAARVPIGKRATRP